MYIVIRDAGKLVRQVSAESGKGVHRSAWDLRMPPPDPINLRRKAIALLDAPIRLVRWCCRGSTPRALPLSAMVFFRRPAMHGRLS